ncbi:cement precursor protein 3B variant 3, partial [Clonorchis sinensis]
MGLDESKLHHSPKNPSRDYKICLSAPIVPWRIIHQCSIELWKKSHRGKSITSFSILRLDTEYFNFPERPMLCNYQLPYECTPAFCLSRQNIINCRKSRSVFTLGKRKRSTKMAEHFEYNHIPARLSSIQNLHFKSILDTQCGLAVVHLARDMITQFAVVDLCINKFLGSFGRQTIIFNPELTTGKISPDEPVPLINAPAPTRTPLALNQNFNRPHPTTELNPLQRRMGILNEDRQGRSTDEKRHFVATHRSASVLFAFDPRFLHSRIAITNVNFVDPHFDGSALEARTSLTLMTLPTWERVATTTKFKCPVVASRSPVSASTSSRSATGSCQQSPSSTSVSGRVLHRHRAASEANQTLDGQQTHWPTLTSPHILSIFYSRDGYLLFVVSTESRVCRCSTIGHHASSTNVSTVFPFASSESVDDREDVVLRSSPVRVNAATTHDGSRAHQIHRSGAVSFCLPSSEKTEVSQRHRDPIALHTSMLAPTLPGCITLWLTIFNSDTLSRLRTLRFDRPVCPVHTCPTNYIPVMSRCGSRLALITNQYVSQHLGKCRSGLSPACVINTGVLTPASLRHSIPSVNVDVYARTHMNHSRHPDCDLTTSSLMLPSPPVAIDLLQPSLAASGNLSSSSPSPLPRIHFADHYGTSNSSRRGYPDHLMYGSEFYPPGPSTAATSSSTPAIYSGSNSLRQIEVILVYQLPPPPSLQALIRQKIRQ